MSLNSKQIVTLVSGLLDSPIAFNSAYLDLSDNDFHTAIFLSQFFYWSKTMEFEWFYKSYDSWHSETRLSRRHIDKARKTLREKGLIEEKRLGAPCKLYYKLNIEAFIEALGQEKQQDRPVCTKRTNKTVQNVQTSLYDGVQTRVYDSVQTYNITETTTETTTEKEKVEKEILEETDAQTHPTPTLDVSTEDSVKIPYREIVESYHRNLPTLPKVFEFTDKRKAGIRRIWTKEKRSRSMSWWDKYFQYASRSSFLMGSNQRGWRANFDFLINYSNHIKLVEGGYHKEEE